VKLFFFILAFCSSCAFASNDWINLAQTKDNKTLEAKQGTFKKTYDGGQILVRMTQPKGQKPTVSVVSIKNEFCISGYGFVTVTALTNEGSSNLDYIAQEKTLSGLIGDVLCLLIVARSNPAL